MKIRVAPTVNENIAKEFKRIASTKSFSKNYFSLAMEEAMLDYIEKNGGETHVI